MSKTFAFVCAVFALALVANAHGVRRISRDESGICGNDIRWKYESDTGAFTLTGFGPMWDYLNHSSIPWWSFRKNITSVVFDNRITRVGQNAFMFAENMKTVSLPTSLKSIGQDAFFTCSNLTSVTFPEGLEMIDLTAFSSCESLTSVKLPASLNHFGFNVFGSCTKLEKIDVDSGNRWLKSVDGVLFNKTVPNLISYPGGKGGDYVVPSDTKTIGANAFWSAHLVTSIVLPQGITEINHGTFYGCSSMKTINIPTGVTSIGNYAFERCSSLTSLVIPSKVTSIGFDAFYDCTSLKYFSYLGETEPECGSYAFKNDNALDLMCVPEAYNSTSLCGLSISCRSSTCNYLGSPCFDVSDDKDICEFTKSEAAVDWEKHSNGCLEYKCNDENGFVAKSKCSDNSMSCVDDKCFDKDEVSGKTYVVTIEFDSSDKLIVESGDIAKELSKLTKIDEYDLKTVIEYDEHGVVKRALVYVDDEEQAKDVTDAVNNLDKGASCQGVLCDSKKAEMKEIHQKSPDSSANVLRSMIGLFMAMAIILLSIN